jgi:hypothetical protein
MQTAAGANAGIRRARVPIVASRCSQIDVNAPQSRVAAVVRAPIVVFADDSPSARAGQLGPAAVETIVYVAGVVIVAGASRPRPVLASASGRAGVLRAVAPVVTTYGSRDARPGRRIAGVLGAGVAVVAGSRSMQTAAGTNAGIRRACVSIVASRCSQIDMHAPQSRVAAVVRAPIAVFANDSPLARAEEMGPAADEMIVDVASIVIVTEAPRQRSVLASAQGRAGVFRAVAPVVTIAGPGHARAGRRIAGVHGADVAAVTDPGNSQAGNRPGRVLHAGVARGAGGAVLTRASGGLRDTDTGALPVARIGGRARVPVVAGHPGRLIAPGAPGVPVAEIPLRARRSVVAGRARGKGGRHAAGRRVAAVHGAGIPVIAIQGVVPAHPGGRVARIDRAGIVVGTVGGADRFAVEDSGRDKSESTPQQNRQNSSHVRPPQ